jgi:putative salt-induced outer membrane protein
MVKKLALILILFPLVSMAADEVDPTPVGWTGEGALGYTSTSGNSDTENLRARLAVSRESDQWKHTASLDAIKNESDDETSADSLALKARSEYNFGEKSYAFGQLRLEDDEFSGYEYQRTLTFGVGSRFIENEKHLLDASIGLGYRSLKDSETEETEEDNIVTADVKYEYKISETATFIQTILIEDGDENTYTESDTSLKIRIVGNLAAKISYLVKRNSEVPASIDKSDKITTVSLVYAF